MNQLVESIDSEGEEKYYYYDTWGNLISDGIAQYYYDHLNRLREYRPFGVSDGTHYTYYIDNLRKSKDDTYFIWLDGNMVYEFTEGDSSTYTYGIHLATSDDYIYVLNAHGDVVALISTTDEVVKRYEYDSYGNELNIDTTDTNPFRYCGEYYDRETGQIYLRARYYQPIVGRFTQRDTHWNTANMIYGDEVKTKEYKDYLGLNDYSVKLVDYAAIRQSGNLYGYCGNNPVTLKDPRGDSWIAVAVAFIITGVVVAIVAYVEEKEGYSYFGAIGSTQIIYGSPAKSASKITSQMTRRGWNTNMIESLINNPFTTRKSVNRATGNPAIVYYDEDGNYVVVDSVTNELVQMSDRNDSDWMPDSDIEDPYTPNRR